MLLGVGVAGLVLPVLPGTIFLILSLACFSRSSPRLEAWMLSNRMFGPSLRRWREHQAMPLAAKRAATAMIVLASGFSAWATRSRPEAMVGIAVLGAAGVWYVLSRATYHGPEHSGLAKAP